VEQRWDRDATGRSGGSRVAAPGSLAPGAPQPHSPAWRGPLPRVSPRRPLCFARVPGGPFLGSVPCVGSPPCAPAALRPSGRGALTRSSSAGCDRGGRDPSWAGRAGAQGESPCELCLSQPPTGVSHLPYSQTSGGGGAGELWGIM
jgi:hypothetical protein